MHSVNLDTTASLSRCLASSTRAQAWCKLTMWWGLIGGRVSILADRKERASGGEREKLHGLVSSTLGPDTLATFFQRTLRDPLHRADSVLQYQWARYSKFIPNWQFWQCWKSDGVGIHGCAWYVCPKILQIINQAYPDAIKIQKHQATERSVDPHSVPQFQKVSKPVQVPLAFRLLTSPRIHPRRPQICWGTLVNFTCKSVVEILQALLQEGFSSFHQEGKDFFQFTTQLNQGLKVETINLHSIHKYYTSRQLSQYHQSEMNFRLVHFWPQVTNQWIDKSPGRDIFLFFLLIVVSRQRLFKARQFVIKDYQVSSPWQCHDLEMEIPKSSWSPQAIASTSNATCQSLEVETLNSTSNAVHSSNDASMTNQASKSQGRDSFVINTLFPWEQSSVCLEVETCIKHSIHQPI